MTSSQPLPAPFQWFSRLAAALDHRSAPRLALLFFGAVLARRLLTEVVRPLLQGATRLTLALDDTPTLRYGPHVKGAGVHHNPTPGPAGSGYVYGHVFVVLALLVAHSAWGVVALPLLARLYVRKKDLPGIDPKHRQAFRTKLELAIELLRWAKPWLDQLNVPIWVVADGAYAKKEFLKPAESLGMTVVSRLRKDAALRSLPGPRPAGKRGRPRTYGPDVIDLAKRAGQRRVWSTETLTLYGVATVKKYKTFLATWRPAGGVIRVVLVDEPTGWRAYFCTDTSASVADILGAVADRFSLEITFRECKQVVGAGQQQVRFILANIGAFHICLWTFTLTEAWAWGRKADDLVDRSASPWDSTLRRPSHADKRRAWRRELLGEEIRATLRPGATESGIQATAERLLSLAA
ncbi:transposase [Tautonia sp. JC769]|uniref:IS701 family transposase n=1 Tax=Tautonia sp. JC769 TaxID=3232135 RepID=UPI003457AC7D